MEFNPVKFNLSDITNSVIEIYDRNIKNKGIKIIKNYKPHIDIYADEHMVSAIVRNLLSNALKFSPSDGCVEVSLEALDNVTVSLAIQDCGQGIPEDEIELIFDKFMQSSRTKGAGGSGLGLAISQKIVEAHGGSVRAVNNAGSGATFLVELPLVVS